MGTALLQDPQERAQPGSGIPLPIQLCLELLSPRRDTDLLYNLTPESLGKAPDCVQNDSAGCYKYTKLFVGIFMKFYHHLPWLVMALFMYGLSTWLCSLSKHNSITVFNCSISVVLSSLCFPAQLLNGQGRY